MDTSVQLFTPFKWGPQTPDWSICSVVANLSDLKTVTLIPRILSQALTASVEQRRSEKKEKCREQSGSTCDRSESIDDLKIEVAELRSAMREANRNVGDCSSKNKNSDTSSEEGISCFTDAIHARPNELEDLERKIGKANVENAEAMKLLRGKEESLEEQHERTEILQNTVMEKDEELESLQLRLEQADTDRKKLTQGKLEVEFRLSKALIHNEHQQKEVQALHSENVILKEKVLRYEKKEKDLEKTLDKLQVSEYRYRLIVRLSLDRCWWQTMTKIGRVYSGELESWSLVPKDTFCHP